MLTKQEAIHKAEQEIISLGNTSGIELVLLGELTMETQKLWVFFYTSKQYALTGDESLIVGGNAPIAISKYDGRIYETGTAHPIADYIEKIELNLL